MPTTLNTPCESDPDKWFSDEPADVEQAQAACAGCPLDLACREQGRSEEYGVWGGIYRHPDTTQQERLGRILIARRIRAEEGASARTIGRRMGVHHHQVSRWLAA